MAKKFYKKCDIAFWFFIMFLPILLGLISMISYSCNYKFFSSDPFNNSLIGAFNNSILSFEVFIPTFIIQTFTNLFTTIGFNSNVIMLSVLVSWFVWVIYLHLLVDVLAFIPKFFHKWLRRVDKYDE